MAVLIRQVSPRYVRFADEVAEAGSLLTLAPSAVARFFAKVVVSSGGCWEWTGRLLPHGYAQFWFLKVEESMGGTSGKLAHRLSYEFFRGRIPSGLDLDHLCRNRRCVNPAHLEAVTRLENVRRGRGHGSETHCPHGHPYIEGNIYRCRDGSRKCATCTKQRVKRGRQRKRGMA